MNYPFFIILQQKVIRKKRFIGWIQPLHWGCNSRSIRQGLANEERGQKEGHAKSGGISKTTFGFYEAELFRYGVFSIWRGRTW